MTGAGHIVRVSYACTTCHAGWWEDQQFPPVETMRCAKGHKTEIRDVAGVIDMKEVA